MRGCPHQAFGALKVTNLGQTNCDEFVDNFVIKKAGQNLFNCSLCYIQPYLN